MTSKDFIKEIQLYYGEKYNEVQVKLINEWLDETRNDLGRKILLREITRTFNRRMRDGRAILPLIPELDALNETVIAEARDIARRQKEAEQEDDEAATPEEIAEMWAKFKLGDKNAD